MNFQPNWGTTRKGRPIELYASELKASNTAERPLLFVGGVHGDEPEGVVLAEQFLEFLKSTRDQGPRRPWILIPCLNVDGFLRNERTNDRGIDLNRNFPTPDWTAEFKKQRYFPGPSPGSEPEVQSLTKLIADSKPSLIVHFHSYDPCVVYTGHPGKTAAQILAEETPYQAKEDIGYPTPGSLGQYGWLVHQTSVICIEAQRDSDLETVWPIFKPGLQKILDLKVSLF